MANFAEDGTFSRKLNQTLGAAPAGILEVFSALSIFLSITASLGNALILISLHKVSSIHPPTKLLFRNLAVTDLCVGLIVQPSSAIYQLSFLKKVDINVLYYAHYIFWASNLIFCGISVSTSTAISVDRLLALLLGLRYRHVVTLRRVSVVITSFWLIGALTGGTLLWRQRIARLELYIVITLSLVTSIFCYTRIHLKLRNQQAQVQNLAPQGQPNGGEIPLNIARYKKTVSSIMWVQLTLVACYLPIGIAAVLNNVNLKDIEYGAAFPLAMSLVFLSSSLNPILYCWKIREVKQAVKDTIRQLNCV